MLELLFALLIGVVFGILGVRRTYSMGCLILPTILFFAGINLF